MENMRNMKVYLDNDAININLLRAIKGEFTLVNRKEKADVSISVEDNQVTIVIINTSLYEDFLIDEEQLLNSSTIGTTVDCNYWLERGELTLPEIVCTMIKGFV